MKVLVMSSIYPRPENPGLGSFVRTQVEYLNQAGVDIELLLLDGPHRKWNYVKAVFQLRRRLANSSIDLVASIWVRIKSVPLARKIPDRRDGQNGRVEKSKGKTDQESLCAE